LPAANVQRAAHLLKIADAPVELARERLALPPRVVFGRGREVGRLLLDLGGQRIAKLNEVGVVLSEATLGIGEARLKIGNATLGLGEARLQIGDDFLLAWPY
jgi:hypothetical protein